MVYLAILFLAVVALVATAICYVTLSQIRIARQDKATLIGLGYRLVLRSGLLVAVLYGLGQALAQATFLDAQGFLAVALQQAVAVAAWLVPLVFAGVGVNVLSTGLTMPIEASESTTGLWGDSLPHWLHGPLNWLAKRLG